MVYLLLREYIPTFLPELCRTHFGKLISSQEDLGLFLIIYYECFIGRALSLTRTNAFRFLPYGNHRVDRPFIDVPCFPCPL